MCLLKFYIIIVVSVKILVISINKAEVAVLVAVTVAISVVLTLVVAVAVANFVACCTCIIVNYVIRIDSHHSIIVVALFNIIAVYFNLV